MHCKICFDNFSSGKNLFIFVFYISRKAPRSPIHTSWAYGGRRSNISFHAERNQFWQIWRNSCGSLWQRSFVAYKQLRRGRAIPEFPFERKKIQLWKTNSCAEVRHPQHPRRSRSHGLRSDGIWENGTYFDGVMCISVCKLILSQISEAFLWVIFFQYQWRQ